MFYSNHTETIVKYFVTNLNNHKKNRVGAGFSFIDKASVKRYKNTALQFCKLREIRAVNKIKNLGLKEMPRMALA